jgi:glutamyl-Q tRNA(Asp) synthetase
VSDRGGYLGRFAPSPTGPLHAGSLVAALASWLDAKAHGGAWLVRIEDVDTPRCVPGAAHTILKQLADCGLLPDEPPIYQSQRSPLYQAALDQLIEQQQAYACGCSRQDIESALQESGHVRLRGSALVYPGTCRHGLAGKTARSWRFSTENFIPNEPSPQSKRALFAPINIANSAVNWTDRKLREQSQNVAAAVGDFVLKRADGLYAYQLAVVVDDAAQGVTHVVRGADLLDNTARQILLQRALGLGQPGYLHVPVVNGADGEKLSKQNHAEALDTSNPSTALIALQNAGLTLGLRIDEGKLTNWLAAATRLWAATYN